ncbi:hypothetical protein [Gemmobacter sp. 24YEA27]|uniref:hypothetical protein n=1 Tax=Gemmobacter sp. 24YEA27 TaxID=3040672 RepID=UPI0024B3AA23|nr:hypothetical protein [Gemmobacter sp. 24YEA27]
MPKICDAGGISKDGIGAIRVQQDVTYVQIAEQLAGRFKETTEIEPGLTMERVAEAPEFGPKGRVTGGRPERAPREGKPAWSPRPSRGEGEEEAPRRRAPRVRQLKAAKRASPGQSVRMAMRPVSPMRAVRTAMRRGNPIRAVRIVMRRPNRAGRRPKASARCAMTGRQSPHRARPGSNRMVAARIARRALPDSRAMPARRKAATLMRAAMRRRANRTPKGAPRAGLLRNGRAASPMPGSPQRQNQVMRNRPIAKAHRARPAASPLARNLTQAKALLRASLRRARQMPPIPQSASPRRNARAAERSADHCPARAT